MADDGDAYPVTKRGLLTAAGALAVGAVGGTQRAWGSGGPTTGAAHEVTNPTTTPIEHLVVVFQENVSFDHYFGTYPHARNPAGVPQFHAEPDTPSVEGLDRALLEHNPNESDPRRLGRDQALTADMNHGYEAEQRAFDHGRMDEFVAATGGESGCPLQYSRDGLVMDYYDGNTVTAMWNYAQRFTLNDNFFGTVTGPSTPGALNLVSGQTHGGYWVDGSGSRIGAPDRDLNAGALAAVDGDGVGTVVGDPDPAWDDRSATPGIAMTGRNVGDLLTDAGVTWGWFQDGFRWNSFHLNAGTLPVRDYSTHHAPFQYYESTANPSHRPPASVDEIGHDGRANHQYDLSEFFVALRRGRLPAVSFLKAARGRDGHPGYSDPLSEQRFLVNTLNAIQRTPYWESTAVVIAYDDSDGWYDHVMPPTVNPSRTRYDVLTRDGPGSCPPLGGYQGRYGYGPRLPLLVVSPYSRVNAVDSTLTDQTSILRFVEDNWGLGRIGDGSFDELAGTIENAFDFENPTAWRLFLDPKTGLRVDGPPDD